MNLKLILLCLVAAVADVNACGLHLLASDTEQSLTITVPSYWRTTNTYCTWSITASPQHNVSLFLDSKNFFPWSITQLEIFEKSKFIRKITRNDLPIRHISNGDSLTLFLSASPKTWETFKFSAKYVQVPSKCEHRVQASKVVQRYLSSPNYFQYNNKPMKCVWTIIAAPPNKILFAYNALQIRGNFQVRDGGKYVETYSEDHLPAALDYLSRGNNMSIELYSAGQGFDKFSGSFVEVSCGRNLLAKSTSSILQPPVVTKPSLSNYCYWMIKPTSKNRYVQLTIEHLDIRSNDSFVKVYTWKDQKTEKSGILQKDKTPINWFSAVSQGGDTFLAVYFQYSSSNISNTFRATYKEVDCGFKMDPQIYKTVSTKLPRQIVYSPSNVICDYYLQSVTDNWWKVNIAGTHNPSLCKHIQIYNSGKFVGEINGKQKSEKRLFYGNRIHFHYENILKNYTKEACSFEVMKIGTGCPTKKSSGTC